jgi:hypothetical protein
MDSPTSELLSPVTSSNLFCKFQREKTENTLHQTKYSRIYTRHRGQHGQTRPSCTAGKSRQSGQR